MSKIALLWLRNDLRLDDNPALSAAKKSGAKIIPFFIFPQESDWPMGAASRWWLHHSLKSFQNEFEKLGSRLILRSGLIKIEIPKLVSETKADSVFVNKQFEPSSIRDELAIEAWTDKNSVSFLRERGNLLFEPHSIKTAQGKFFQVFTPFWKACLSAEPPPKPLPKISELNSPNEWPKSLSLSDLKLLPKLNWASEFSNSWTPGVEGARENVKRFFSEIEKYHTQRDLPSVVGTSRLSPHLHFGEISVRRLWWMIHEKFPRASKGRDTYLKELGWRDFAHHLLFFLPDLPDKALREEFSKFPWVQNKNYLKAWQKGLTGYPLVDAGMRELWATGWMHNRVRMVVASFLVKHLLLSWQDGARWFWDTLVDADLANNTLGWQWSAGCGPDAAPYFRIFNPQLQMEKFDSANAYIKKWVPEFGTPAYPQPIVDHQEARKKALEAFAKIQKK